MGSNKGVVHVLNGKLAFENGSGELLCHFPSPWLADQCRCRECFHEGTLQRLSEESVSIRHSPVVSVDFLDSSLSDQSSIVVTYKDTSEHQTLHPLSHLRHVAMATQRDTVQISLPPPGTDKEEEGKKKKKKKTLPEEIEVADDGVIEARDVMQSEDAVLRILRRIRRDGYAFVENLEVSEDYTRTLLQRIGYMRSTLFGDFWSFTVDTESTQERLQHADTAYTGLAIEPHTDGSYALEPPGLQSFHVLDFQSSNSTTSHESAAARVESVLVDGFSVARQFRGDDRRAFDVLCGVPLDWKYYDPHKWHLHCVAPVITLDTVGELQHIRWNHYDRGDLRHLLKRHNDDYDNDNDNDVLLEVFDALEKWRLALRETPHKMVYTLTPGRLVVFDNWRMLHGRSPFRGRRTLCGCYHDRQLFLSRLSVLNNQSTDAFA